jgi:hypothetical protein
LPTESIDTYYDHFQELLEDLVDADEPILTKAAIRHFIFTLGSDFDTIQHNFRINNLPQEWLTQDWPSLLTLCRNYHKSIKPTSSTKRSTVNPKDTTFDRDAHQKKVMQPTKFCREIEATQRKHSGQCIYHLSKTHQTTACFVKKECDKLIAEGKSGGSNGTAHSSTSARLRHITEEHFEDATMEEQLFDLEDNTSNDINEDVLAYFTCMSNHYFRLAQVIPASVVPSRHTMEYPIIADSGANYHMFKEREFFSTLTPTSGTVLLGDGKSRIDIKGVGTVTCYIDNHLVSISNFRCIPDLGESVYSLFLHVKSPGHGLDSTSDQGLFLTFPDFRTKVIIGSNDIYLNILPV